MYKNIEDETIDDDIVEDQTDDEDYDDTYDDTDDDKNGPRTADMRENAVEWYTGDDRVTVTLTQRKFKNKVQNLAEKHPEEVEILSENADGSIYAHIPLSYLSIRRPREVSEEMKQAAKERMEKLWQKKKEDSKE